MDASDDACEVACREWNTDAFLIGDDVLEKHCKRVASRLIRDAITYRQQYDCTSRRLMRLYYRQRGRCAILGFPLVKMSESRGKSPNCFPYEIELDHIVQVERTKGIRAIANGKPHEAGAFALMQNLRWVSNIGHSFRHWIEDKPSIACCLWERLAAVYKYGAPCNDTIDVQSSDDIDGLVVDGVSLSDFVSTCVASKRFVPDAGAILRAALNNGYEATSQKIWDELRRLGVNLKTYKREKRIAVIRERLTADVQLLNAMVNGSVTFRRAQELMESDFAANDVRSTSTLVFAGDVRAAASRMGIRLGIDGGECDAQGDQALLELAFQ